MIWICYGSRDSLLVRFRAPDLRSKGCEFKSRQEWQEIFFSSVNFLYWLLLGVRSTPNLPQWHVKDPSHSAKSAEGRLRLNTHTPLTQQSWSGLTMLLFRHSVGTYQEISSLATHQGTLRHSCLSVLATGLKSGMRACGLTSSLAKKKSAGGERMVEHCPRGLASEEKATTKKPPPKSRHAKVLNWHDIVFLFMCVHAYV